MTNLAVKDGVFLYKSGLNPYEGGTFHHVRPHPFPPSPPDADRPHLSSPVSFIPPHSLHHPPNDLPNNRLDHIHPLGLLGCFITPENLGYAEMGGRCAAQASFGWRGKRRGEAEMAPGWVGGCGDALVSSWSALTQRSGWRNRLRRFLCCSGIF